MKKKVFWFFKLSSTCPFLVRFKAQKSMLEIEKEGVTRRMKSRNKMGKSHAKDLKWKHCCFSKEDGNHFVSLSATFRAQNMFKGLFFFCIKNMPKASWSKSLYAELSPCLASYDDKCSGNQNMGDILKMHILEDFINI